MKKAVVLFFALLIVSFLFSACNTMTPASPSNVGNSGYESTDTNDLCSSNNIQQTVDSQNSSNSVTNNITQNTDLPKVEEEATNDICQTTDYPKIDSDATPPQESNDLPDAGESGDLACSIEYIFASIEDLETFIKTGSKNESDYSSKPITNLGDIPWRNLADRYISISKLLNIKEDLFSNHTASFQFSENGNITYRYYLDNTFVMIRETDCENVKDYLMEKKSDFDANHIHTYEKVEFVQEGYVLREDVALNIVYDINNGVRNIAYFVYNGYAITINGTWYSNDTTISKDYQEFMTSEKTAPIAALFSDEQTIFENTIKSFYEKTGDATLK